MVRVKDLLDNTAVFLTPLGKPRVFTFVPADVIIKSGTVNI